MKRNCCSWIRGPLDIFKAGEEFGLGAHLAARIIKLFDGIIQVSSKNNKITVEIILPRYIKQLNDTYCDSL